MGIPAPLTTRKREGRLLRLRRKGAGGGKFHPSPPAHIRGRLEMIQSGEPYGGYHAGQHAGHHLRVLGIAGNE
eukprot:11575704-Heterocapsa_arctica.AAC.1